jgi:hypothetical protein
MTSKQLTHIRAYFCRENLCLSILLAFTAFKNNFNLFENLDLIHREGNVLNTWAKIKRSFSGRTMLYVNSYFMLCYV